VILTPPKMYPEMEIVDCRANMRAGFFKFLKNISNQQPEWKKQLLENAADIFSRDRKPEQVPSLKELHARIGQLSMENDFLSHALGRIGEPSAKK
jgi:hypothetical protein